MTPKQIEARLRDAFDRCAIAHDTTRDAFVSFVWMTDTQAEQRNHGTTDFALAAWYSWRPNRTLRRARGLTDYHVPDMRGQRTIPTSALVLEDADLRSLVLTGCSWGYGGEGPHGSALVLVNAGFFEDLETALFFVAGLDGGVPWHLDYPSTPERKADQ